MTTEQGSRGISRGQRLASGQTVAQQAAEAELDALTESVEEAQLDVERSRTFTSLSLSRMRTDWHGENASQMARIHDEVNQVMVDMFGDAYALIGDIYDVVRTPEVDEETGEVAVDQWGFTKWKRNPLGFYEEDWQALSLRQREDFLFRITTALFAWEQQAADLWGDAMFAKAVWTESFAVGFDARERGTVDDRTAHGNIASAEDRYFALYLSMLSRKAEALTRSMERIGQRLKDGLGT